MVYLNEYQIKKIFSRKGIRVPRSVMLREKGRKQGFAPLKKIPWSEDVVLKAQVPVSSRFKKGLVLFSSNLNSQLSQKCQLLFKRIKQLGLGGDLLLEEKVPHHKEHYLALVSDPVTKNPLFLFSPRGGVDVEKNGSGGVLNLEKLTIDPWVGLQTKALGSLFSRAGLRDEEKIRELTRISLMTYEIYRAWQCHFVELNPLVETEKGFYVLDAKMEIDEDATSRLNPEMQRMLSAGTPKNGHGLEEKASEIDHHDYRGTVHFLQMDTKFVRHAYGKKIRAFVGFNAVGTGVGLTAMDELVRNGFFPRNFCDTSGNPTASKIYRITKIILSQDKIRGYFFITCLSSQQLDHTARGIIKAFKEIYGKTHGVPTIPTLLLFRGAWDEEAHRLFRDHGILKGNKVVLLGRESTERDAAKKFGALFKNA